MRENMRKQVLFYETFIYNGFKCFDHAHNRNMYTTKRETI